MLNVLERMIRTLDENKYYVNLQKSGNNEDHKIHIECSCNLPVECRQDLPSCASFDAAKIRAEHHLRMFGCKDEGCGNSLPHSDRYECHAEANPCDICEQSLQNE